VIAQQIKERTWSISFFASGVIDCACGDLDWTVIIVNDKGVGTGSEGFAGSGGN
jgi:hypothetical protein